MTDIHARLIAQQPEKWNPSWQEIRDQQWAELPANIRNTIFINGFFWGAAVAFGVVFLLMVTK